MMIGYIRKEMAEMTIQYKTKGVCSQRIDVTVDNSIIKKVEFVGGCAGNTQGVARLVEGLDARDAIGKLAGIRCGFKPTSCPDQLSIAQKKALEKEKDAK